MSQIKDFLGREEILEVLKKRVNGLFEGYRQNVALVGQEHIGKTSIILNLFQSIDRSKYIILYIDAKPAQFVHFVYKFVAAILYNFSESQEEINSSNISSLVQQAKPYAPQTIDLLSKLKLDLDKRRYNTAYRKLLDSLDLLYKETGKPIIFAIDEFHAMEKFKIKNVFADLGRKIMIQKYIMYILLSSSETKADNIIAEKLSLLFGNFEKINIELFDYSNSLDFIHKRLKGIELDKQIKNFIISFTEGNPFYLDVICSEFINVYVHHGKIPYNVLELFSQAMEELLFDQHGILSQYFANYIMRIAHKNSGTKLLSILMVAANNTNKLSEIAKLMKSSLKETRHKLDRLIDLGAVSKNGVFYRIKDKMFGFWLKNVYHKRITDLGWDINQKQKEFQQDLLNYIVELENAGKMPLRERFVKLFDSFDNEFVYIDNKRLKLPRFEKIDIICKSDCECSLLAENQNTHWLININTSEVSENEASEFLKKSKEIECNVNKKIIIGLRGIDVNALLLAKENRIAVWNPGTVNFLFEAYQNPGVIFDENISNI